MSPLYTALPSSHHVRLLQLESGSVPSVAVGSLDVVDLDHDPTYTCLSYTWNGPRYQDAGGEWTANVESILLNGILVPVRRNLYNALLRLKAAGLLGPIWIDALCINQSDIPERNNQVAQMGRIYEGARDVVVWLGEAQPCSVSALRNMDRLTIVPDDMAKMFGVGSPGLKHLIPYVDRIVECGFADSELVEIMDFMVSFRWFSRVWTVQEMILAKELRFLCGNSLVPMTTIWKGSILLLGLGLCSASHRLRDTQELACAKNFTTHVFNEYFRRKVHEPHSSIGVVVNKFRSKVASDPRDNVFGFLGISKTSSKWISRSLTVDYSRTARQVFIEAAVFGLVAWKGLETLCYVGDQTTNNIPDLPSWVPDYTQDIPWKTYQQGERVFTASGAMPTILWYDPAISEKTICVNQKVFDEVVAVCTAYWKEGDQNHIVELLSLCLGAEDFGSPYEDSLATILIRLMTADGFKNDGVDPRVNLWAMFQTWLYCQVCMRLRELDPDVANAFIKNPQSNLSELRRVLPLDGRSDQLAETLLAAREPCQTWEEIEFGSRSRYKTSKFAGYLDSGIGQFTVQWEFACQNRVVFRTKKGYLGIGPRMVQKGDQVCILQGGNVPYIFRHLEKDPAGVFDFVGEAYVHGIMYGEAIQEDAGEGQFQKATVY